MKVKSSPSTAQRLGLYRDELQRHYKALRNEKCKPVIKPSMEAYNFGGYARACAHAIESEELAKHEAAVKQIKEMGR